MFKNRHVYTCPDIIYLRARNKKFVIANYAILALFVAGSAAWSYAEDMRNEKELKDRINNPSS